MVAPVLKAAQDAAAVMTEPGLTAALQTLSDVRNKLGAWANANRQPNPGRIQEPFGRMMHYMNTTATTVGNLPVMVEALPDEANTMLKEAVEAGEVVCTSVRAEIPDVRTWLENGPPGMREAGYAPTGDEIANGTEGITPTQRDAALRALEVVETFAGEQGGARQIQALLNPHIRDVAVAPRPIDRSPTH